MRAAWACHRRLGQRIRGARCQSRLLQDLGPDIPGYQYRLYHLPCQATTTESAAGAVSAIGTGRTCLHFRPGYARTKRRHGWWHAVAHQQFHPGLCGADPGGDTVGSAGAAALGAFAIGFATGGFGAAGGIGFAAAGFAVAVPAVRLPNAIS